MKSQDYDQPEQKSQTTSNADSSGLQPPDTPEERERDHEAWRKNQAKMTPEDRAIGEALVANLNRNLAKKEEEDREYEERRKRGEIPPAPKS